jgi:hypothetical protein
MRKEEIIKRIKKRDVLDEIGREWARGRPKRLEGGSQRQGGIDKNARATQFGSRAYFERSPNPPAKLLPHTFFFADLLYWLALAFVQAVRVVRLNTRGRTLLELVQRSPEPQLIRDRGPGS